LNPTGAVTSLRTAVHVEPKRADAHNALGLALAGSGRSIEAIAEYTRAIELRPDYEAARFNRANALVKAGKLEGAIADYRAVVAVDSQDPTPKRALARALTAWSRQLQSAGKAEEARRALEEAKKLDPGAY